MKLYFARHGESVANILQEISNRGYRHGLTATGRQQASKLAVQLAGAELHSIFTSPLQRAVETSQIVSQALGIPYAVTDALREFDCGIAEGRADPEAWGLHQWVREEWFTHQRYDSRITDGESFYDIQARFGSLVEPLLAGKDRNYLLLGHGGLYITVLPALLCNIDREFVLQRGFANTAYVLAEKRADDLVCLEWCGEPIRTF